MQSSFKEGRLRYFIVLDLLSSSLPSRQELRSELQAAETKDKKFVKRKTVLKRIVANITMGNDSEYSNSNVTVASSWPDISISVTPFHRCSAMSWDSSIRDKEK